MKDSRRAFTMIELLVVITVMLILAGMTYAMLSTGKNTGKLREAARLGQSALLGAKDRAMHAKELRGVRFVRDATDNTLVTAMIYLQPLPLQQYGAGSIQLERVDFLTNGTGMPPPDGLADTTDIVIVRGWDQNNLPLGTAPQPLPVDWNSKSQFFPNPFRVRIPSSLVPGISGKWYTAFINTSGPYAMGAGNEVFQLQTPFAQQPNPQVPTRIVAFDRTSSFNSCDIQLGNDLLPFHAPISLPSGIVIDLKFCSANVRSLAGVGSAALPYIDLMFSPRGMLTGAIAAQGPLHFLLRDLADAANTNVNPFAVGPAGSANPDTNKSDRLILTIFPQTGLVSTFEVDVTDNVNNQTGVAPPDGLADNPFNFALQGRSAGR